MFYNIHTHVYCNSQPRLFSHNKPNTYREIIKQFIRSHLGLLFIIPFCQVRTDFNNINPFGISLGIQCRRHTNICFYNMCIMVPTQWQKKAVTFYSNFPFRIGILCLLSFRSQFLFQHDILMCMNSITQHLVSFSLREPIFRSTIEYFFSLTLVLVSLYVNPAQVRSTDSFCRTSSHTCACRNTYLQKSFADDSGSCPGVSGVRKADRFGALATGSKGVLAPRFSDHGLKFGLGVCKNTKWMGKNVLHFWIFLFAIPFIIITFL